MIFLSSYHGRVFFSNLSNCSVTMETSSTSKTQALVTTETRRTRENLTNLNKMAPHPAHLPPIGSRSLEMRASKEFKSKVIGPRNPKLIKSVEYEPEKGIGHKFLE